MAGVDVDVVMDWGGQDAQFRLAEVPVRVVSFEELFRDEYAATVRLAHLLTGDPVGAEDMAQDAFARLRPHFDDLDRPQAYLRTVTVNVCRNWHRGRSREAAYLQKVGVGPESVTDASAELLDVVDRLPFKQRAVLVLRYWQGATESEIARALGCRPGTVKSLHSRALVQLRKEIPT